MRQKTTPYIIFMVLVLLAVSVIPASPNASGDTRSAAVRAATSSATPDWGDAPDSNTVSGAPMTAYPSTPANFPTAVNPTGGSGPRHANATLQYFLGAGISAEDLADGGFDADGVNNITPALDAADRDGLDDGLSLPGAWPHCQEVELDYTVTVPEGVSGPLRTYLNVWVDWNRSGAWGEALSPCSEADDVFVSREAPLANEWAVQNLAVDLAGPGVYTLKTPKMRVHNLIPSQAMWLRISLSDAQALSADGSGPTVGYAFGETEDYLAPGQPATVAERIFSEPFSQPDFTAFPPANRDLFLPFVLRNKGELPITGPSGNLVETDLAYLGGGHGSKFEILAAAAGSGAGVRLHSYGLFGAPLAPVLVDTVNFAGMDVRLRGLHDMRPRSDQYSLLLTTHRGIDDNLWLTTWRMDDGGHFNKLDMNGYGANDNVQVINYGLAYRPIKDSNGLLVAFQVVTPVIDRLFSSYIRLVSWWIDANSGTILGQKSTSLISFNSLGSTSPYLEPKTNLAVSFLENQGRVDGSLQVSAMNFNEDIINSTWKVSNNGTFTFVSAAGSGMIHLTDRMASMRQKAQAIDSQSLYTSGFATAILNDLFEFELITWENQNECFEGGYCPQDTYQIGSNLLDQDPAGGKIGLTMPPLQANWAAVYNASLDSFPFETPIPPQPAVGIASITKVMNLYGVLRTVDEFSISLDDCVNMIEYPTSDGAEATRVGMTFTPGAYRLRTLLLASIMTSDYPSTKLAAVYAARARAGQNLAYDVAIQQFTAYLNQLAADLGMNDTIICGIAGACNSSMRDQIKLYQAAWQDLDFQAILGKRQFDASDVVAEQNACGFSLSPFSKVGLGDLQDYPGLRGWKGGYSVTVFDTQGNQLGAGNFGVGYDPQTDQLACNLDDVYPNWDYTINQPVFTMSGISQRMGHLFTGLLSQADTLNGRHRDFMNLIEYAVKKQYIPDRRDTKAGFYSDLVDFGLDVLGEERFATAVVDGNRNLHVCYYLGGISPIEKSGCAVTQVNQLAVYLGDDQPVKQAVLIRTMPLILYEKAFITLRREVAGGNTLRIEAWTVAPTE